MARKIDRREFLVAGGTTAALSAVRASPLGAVASRTQVVGLKVDCVECPLGLENSTPRFSWRLESKQRNVHQSAYRILVASSEEMAKAGLSDLWDSGKITAKKSVGIPYQGRKLNSRQRCWWRVRVWDKKGDVSDYSDVSWWEMGLLSPADWHAQWLAVEDAEARVDREAGLHWIWGSTAKDNVSRKFRLKFCLPKVAIHGLLLVGGRDRISGVWLDGQSLPLDSPQPYSYTVQPLSELVLESLRAGEHLLAVEVSQRSDELGSPEGAMTGFVRLTLEDDSITRINGESEWRTHLSTDADWFRPGYDDHDWERAQATLGQASQPWPPTAAMHLRTNFSTRQRPVRGRLYATALGGYEARLNGRRVGDALLTPETNAFSKRVLYQTYDVTEMLEQGANVLGLTVGDGWYASTLFMAGRYAWGPPPRRVLAQLEMTFSDGSRQTVATGPEWRMGPSPILRSEIYNGEIVDNRASSPGWDRPGFDDVQWVAAEIGERPTCHLTAQVSPPIRATQVLKPRAITTRAPAVHVVDFGQNFAGWCRLRSRGPAGMRIELRFAEVLSPSGEIDQSNLRGAKQTDVFTLRGDAVEEEVFEPIFTYHGFRYVQISGLPLAPTTDAIEGIVIHSDLPVTGHLRIEHPLIDQVWRNTVWTQRSNFMGVPTDCPQRDERLGYLADASIFWDAAAFNMDVDAFTGRHMQSAADSQSPKGSYPEWAPATVPEDPPYPGWSDGGVILPWIVWQRYGDLSIIEQNWEGMNRYVHGILRNNPDYLWSKERSDNGDWLAVDQKFIDDPTTPNQLIGTAYWAHSVDLLAQMSEAIGRERHAALLRSLHARIRRAFIKTFIRADGLVGNESQTSYVLALKYGLVPDELRSRAEKRLVADIQKRGKALSTGILGTQYLLDVLAEAGYTNLAYDLLLRTEYPSWGFMIAQGGSTIWEGWNGRVWSGPKGETMPNSYNHYALGAICGFLFRRVAGIDVGTPGFESTIIRPALDHQVTHGGGDYDSVMGRISTDWAQTPDGGFALRATIPANTCARIHLPAKANSRIEEGRTEISHHQDIRIMNRLAHEAVIAVGSGTYQFKVTG